MPPRKSRDEPTSLDRQDTYRARQRLSKAGISERNSNVRALRRTHGTSLRKARTRDQATQSGNQRLSRRTRQDERADRRTESEHDMKHPTRLLFTLAAIFTLLWVARGESQEPVARVAVAEHSRAIINIGEQVQGRDITDALQKAITS